MSRDFGTRPRDSSFDLPPPPVFDLNNERTPGNNRFESNRILGETSFGENKSPLNKKSPGIFARSSTPTLQTSQLGHRQDTSCKDMPNYSTTRKAEMMTECPGDRIGQLTTTVDYRSMNEKFRSNDGYPLEDSTYDDDGLYSPVDYKGPNRASGNVVDKIAMSNGDDSDDDLYTSMSNMDLGTKHEGVSATSMDSKRKTAFNADNVGDRLYTSEDNNDLTSKMLQNRSDDPKRFSKTNTATSNVVQNGPKSFPNSNGFVDEDDDMPVYATVDKSRIPLKQPMNNFLQESEFEIPPPIPDKLFLETGDFQESSGNTDSIYSEKNRHDFTNSIAVKHEDNFVPSATVQMNGRNENAVVETNIASFPERLRKFNGESSVGKSDRNGVVQKLKKKKKRSKSSIVQVNETKLTLFIRSSKAIPYALTVEENWGT